MPSVALVDRLWYSKHHALALALWPLAAVFGLITALRRFAYKVGMLRTRRFDSPVVVVGNITVGGTGKTPLVIWLAGYLKNQGLRPGIVTRGYGGRAQHWPQQVRPDSDPVVVGDEAVMLAARTGRPVCVGPDRPAAVAALLAHTDTDIVLCDDGLQHYALGRDLEIAVVDGQRRFGNGSLLPAGPLREPVSRLETVDFVISNGQPRPGEYTMQLTPIAVVSLDGQQHSTLQALAGQQVHAIAGIGNPQRFFDLLTGHGLSIAAHAFPDHHEFTAEDLAFDDDAPVLMTDKDAVKCRRLCCSNCWVVVVDAQPDAAFVERLSRSLKEILDG